MERQFVCHSANGTRTACAHRQVAVLLPPGTRGVRHDQRQDMPPLCCHAARFWHNDLAVIMGQQEHCVRRPKGCTPCDRRRLCSGAHRRAHRIHPGHRPHQVEGVRQRHHDTHRSEYSLRSHVTRRVLESRSVRHKLPSVKCPSGHARMTSHVDVGHVRVQQPVAGRQTRQERTKTRISRTCPPRRCPCRRRAADCATPVHAVRVVAPAHDAVEKERHRVHILVSTIKYFCIHL